MSKRYTNGCLKTIPEIGTWTSTICEISLWLRKQCINFDNEQAQWQLNTVYHSVSDAVEGDFNSVITGSNTA